MRLVSLVVSALLFAISASAASEPIWNLIGRTYTPELVAAFTTQPPIDLGPVDDNIHHAFEKDGIEVICDRDARIITIYLHPEFRGALPGGLDFKDDHETVHDKLGLIQCGSDRDIEAPWEIFQYDDVGLKLDFDARWALLHIALVDPEGVASCAPLLGPAPDLTYLHEDECPGPFEESLRPEHIRGSVIRVVMGKFLDIRTREGAERRVRLPGVSTSRNEKAAGAFVESYVGNKRVDVETYSPGSRVLAGIVRIHDPHQDWDDVSTAMLKAGVATFAKVALDSVGAYDACLFRIAEREARAAHVGLWKND
ncbi:MAG TPA: thermonuclease family protein [Thermoanaerobaculia bacterium]|nr:thermonuclease family protein [Thermoanaerobaculia bacterium]